VTETRDSRRLDAVAESPGLPPATAEALGPALRPPATAEALGPALRPPATAKALGPALRPPATTEALGLPPDDLVVRPAAPADLPAIMAMAHAAFGYDLEAKLIERLELERRVAAAVVAVSGGDMVGHALLSRVALTAAGEAPRPALALAPVAVAPGHQGRGIGSLVVRTCIRLAEPRLPVFVIGDPAFYGRFGFEPAAPHRVTSRFDVAPGHFMVRLAGPAPADPVARRLDYPSAFDGC
jgi:putative acetyltransferase